MTYSSIISAIGIAATITLVQPNIAVALERSEIAAKAKQFTVQIDGEETGSGAIIDRNGKTYTVVYSNLGRVYGDRKDYQRAIPDYTQALLSCGSWGNRNPADAYYNRGNAYRNLEEYQRAISKRSASFAALRVRGALITPKPFALVPMMHLPTTTGVLPMATSERREIFIVLIQN